MSAALAIVTLKGFTANLLQNWYFDGVSFTDISEVGLYIIYWHIGSIYRKLMTPSPLYKCIYIEPHACEIELKVCGPSNTAWSL